MRIPVWLTIAVAILVIGFGAFRLRLAFKTGTSATPPRRGMYAMGRRTHALIGVVYLLLGGALVATSFGWNPFGDYFSVGSAPPAKDAAPTRTPVPIDQLPAKK